MSDNLEPMIRLDPDGSAPVLSYSVPETSVYGGRSYIELDFPVSYFTAYTRRKPTTTADSLKDMDVDVVEARIDNYLSGTTDTLMFDLLETFGATTNESTFTLPQGFTLDSDDTTPPDGVAFSASEALNTSRIARNLMEGQRYVKVETMFGDQEVRTYEEPNRPKPRLVLIETYRLSSYRGNYGAGDVLKTFSLLPGERTKISIKTYRRRESDAKSASSIFDSFSKESSKSFEKSVESEQSDKKGYQDSFGYHAKASLEANWGFGKAAVSGGVKGSTSSSRNEFARNLSRAVGRHSAQASAKRDVQVNTSYEVKEQIGEETAIEREIENINVGRTLSFVFRQMNQEFISILHLVDVRLGYTNGYSDSYRETSIGDIDLLLEEVIVPSRRESVREVILDELKYIPDYQDNLQSFVEEKSFTDEKRKKIFHQTRIRKDLKSEFKEKGFAIQVPGIILAVSRNTLRTEGIIVDSILGQGNALDDYSESLQKETIATQRLQNELLQLQIEREKLLQGILERKDEHAARLVEQVFPPTPNEAEEPTQQTTNTGGEGN